MSDPRSIEARMRAVAAAGALKKTIRFTVALETPDGWVMETKASQSLPELFVFAKQFTFEEARKHRESMDYGSPVKLLVALEGGGQPNHLWSGPVKCLFDHHRYYWAADFINTALGLTDEDWGDAP